MTDLGGTVRQVPRPVGVSFQRIKGQASEPIWHLWVTCMELDPPVMAYDCLEPRRQIWTGDVVWEPWTEMRRLGKAGKVIGE